MKKLLFAMLLALPIYQETPYSKPLNPLDKPPNPYQRDCYVQDYRGHVKPCNF